MLALPCPLKRKATLKDEVKMMKGLSLSAAARFLPPYALVEGISICATRWVTGATKGTVTRLFGRDWQQ